MLGIHDLGLFTVSGLLLNILPGPDSLLIMMAFVVLGCIFDFNGMLWCNALSVFTAFASDRLKLKPRVTQWLNRVTGGLFLALGLRLALAKQN